MASSRIRRELELPEDLIDDILRRLPPRSLAVSRCVCRAWRDLVDARRLLRADLLPCSFAGVFVLDGLLDCPDFFVRPTTGPSISSELDFIPGFAEAMRTEVLDNCNGLLLCKDASDDDLDYVANPATRRWAHLPVQPLPAWEMWSEQGFSQIKCLVYDPTLSPHYQVFLIHSLNPEMHRFDLRTSRHQKPIPKPKPTAAGVSSSYQQLQVYVYSSETGSWEERWFAPEGQPTIVDKDIYWILDRKAYWRGALYLLCASEFVLRISISNAKYRLIPIPNIEFLFSDIEFTSQRLFSLGTSKKGVYLAFKYDSHRLRIFLLNETRGQMVWELRHSVDLRHSGNSRENTTTGQQNDTTTGQQNGPWILQDIDHYKYSDLSDKHKEVGGNFEWNSDDDNVLSTEDMTQGHYQRFTGFLGFHPYKEIVFLHTAFLRVVAYHWNTSKFQDLGHICPNGYYEYEGHYPVIDASFVYTPCWMEDFPNKSQVPTEDSQNLYKLQAKVLE